jgi:hypothetical protein
VDLFDNFPVVTAAPRHSELGYGYTAARVNYAFHVHSVLTTEEAAKAIEHKKGGVAAKPHPIVLVLVVVLVLEKAVLPNVYELPEIRFCPATASCRANDQIEDEDDDEYEDEVPSRAHRLALN